MDAAAERDRGFSAIDQKIINSGVRGLSASSNDHVTSPREWRQLMEAFVNAGKSIDVSDYAEKKKEFSPDEFAIVSDVGSFSESEYVFRNFSHPSMEPVRAHAPLVYALKYTAKTDQSPRIIGVVSFRLDLKNQLVLIEQIQGGNTAAPFLSRPAEEYAARKQFRGANPEYALYDAVRQFALACNFQGIGIRKGISSDDKKVSKRAERGIETLYDKVALHANHAQHSPFTGGDLDEYTFEELTMTQA
jgi:hypothetical protein